MILVLQKFEGSVHSIIIQWCQFLLGELHFRRLSQTYLDKCYHAIIQYSHEFITNAVIDFLVSFLLDASDALCFYEDLIRNTRQAQHTPRRAVITRLLEEQLLAGGDYL